jgi:hypothetical protein
MNLPHDEKTPTEEDGRRALLEHARERGSWIHENFGPKLTDEVLLEALKNTSVARYPVKISYGGCDIPEDTFGICELQGDNPAQGYSIQLHSYYKDRQDCLAPLVLYLLVKVNYGEAADSEVAEHFGAAALGIPVDDYYEDLCRMVDCLAG